MTIFAAIQINSRNNISENVNKTIEYIKKAATNGAKVIAIPETFTYIGDPKKESDKYKVSLDSEIVENLSKLAKEYKIYLIAGSFHELIENSEKTYNTSLLFSPEGEIISKYQKIHLFDIESPTVTLKESNDFEFGSVEQSDVIKTTYGNLSTTICYDLRFPELYTKLALKGAQIIFVPAAFTMQTGKEHWEVLLRARAIENEVYIIAPNQFGKHGKNRESYGNSMIVDPWGKVIVRASDQECIIYADINLDYQKEIRQNLPCLEHKRLIQS